jgi:molybdopterin converting factor subunit 1
VKVRVLYFAAVRDVVAKGEESVDLGEDVKTVRDFVAWVGARYPQLAPRMASVRIARNEAFAASDERIADGDVLALIPPVAGG